jgi:two-component system response regulator RegX3
MDLLVVEDDDAIAEPLVDGLRREGFEPRRVSTGRAALEEDPGDLVLLDLGLPDIDGKDVCRQLRQRSQVPVIVITARGDEIDRVVLLELGADDYVVKPFGFRELVARIRAVLRRTAGSVPDDAGGTVELAGLAIDRRARRVSVGGEEVQLTPKEYDLLALLASEPGAVFTREEIMSEVWDEHWYGPTKTLDVHMASLRKKLGDPGWITTIRGVGFRLEGPG